MAGRLIWGLAWSLIWVGGATIILDVTTDGDRGRWTGLYQTWFFMGAAIGAFAGGFLTDRLGYSAALWIGAGVTTLGGVVALIYLPETRSSKSMNLSYPNNETAQKWRPNSELVSVVSLQGINRFVTAGVLAATIALLVQEQLSMNNLVLGVATVTGILIGLRTILSMFAAPLAGSLSDKSGNRWGVTMAGLIFGSIGMFLLIRPDPVFILVGIGFSAIAGGSIQALVTTRTGDLVDQEQRGKAIGLLHTSGDLGSALGPITAYFLLRWINLSGVYIICAFLFALGAGISLRMYWRYRSSSNLLTKS
jgi:MFS family permease